MPEYTCKECGAVNAPDARFCKGCDAYLGWDSAPPSDEVAPHPGATPTDESRAKAPQVELITTEAVVEPDSGATVEIRVRNNSTIVDAYRVDPIEAPAWLTLEQPEIRLMPGESQSVTVTFGIKTATLVEAQTVKVPLRICSLRDNAKYADTQVALTVPPSGPGVTVEARPTVISLVDETAGRLQVILHNESSNHSRRVVLSGSDTEDVVRFEFPSPAVEIAAGKSACVDVRFTVPELHDGENRSRQLTVKVSEGDKTADVAVTVDQRRSPALPLKLRLEPSTLRVRDCPIADLSLLVDNREGKQDRRLRLGGRDTEGAVRFTFPTPEIHVRAGQVAKVRFSVQASPPAVGEQVSRPFTVVAAEGPRESETAGTFMQITSEPPIKTATLRIAPETLRRRDKTNGRFQVAIDNNDTSQWLNANLFGWDRERVMRFAFSPDRFDIPPGGSTGAWVSVWAPSPQRGAEVTRTFTLEASDGRESVATTGTFIQSRSNWVPIVRAVLILVGGVSAIVGTFTPWMVMVPDYYLTELPKVAYATDIVEKTQPAVRAAILFMAVMMMIGVAGKGGKAALSTSVLMVTTLIGYFVFVTSQVGTGGPMYGAVLVGVGAGLALVGGLLGRR